MEIKNIKGNENDFEILWDHDNKSQIINFPNDKPNRIEFNRRIVKEYSEQPQGFFIGWIGKKPVASIICKTRVNSYKVINGSIYYGDIRAIYLEKEHRGKGFGTALLNHAKKYFKDKECSYMRAEVFAGNDSSNKCMKQNGGYVERVTYNFDL